MSPLDQDTLTRVAETHAQAWQDLLASTAAIAALPLRTVQTLTGWPEAPAAGDRLDEAEREIAALRQALEAERGARRAEVRRLGDRLETEQALVAELRQAYARLESEGDVQVDRARQDQALAIYQTLEPLLTQLPVVRHAVGEGRDVAAADLLALLGPLDLALGELGIVPIGQVGETLPFDPQTHQMARGPIPEAGEPVTVRHVGYRLGGQLLRRARVSLPAE
jgi:molecular chaperone GrpE (heat shock protein)